MAIRQSTRRVSRATMHKEMSSIANRASSRAFDEMFKYAVRVNPNGYAFVHQYLRTMRHQLDRREAIERQQVERSRQLRRASRSAAEGGGEVRQ